MKPFTRADRVSGQIQRILSEVLSQKTGDPRLEMVTITGVKMSPDLRLAKIYFSVTGTTVSKTEAADGFQTARGFLKRALARRLGLRYMPDFRFYHDESFDYGSHIDNVLKSIESNNGSDHPSTTE